MKEAKDNQEDVLQTHIQEYSEDIIIAEMAKLDNKKNDR